MPASAAACASVNACPAAVATSCALFADSCDSNTPDDFYATSASASDIAANN